MPLLTSFLSQGTDLCKKRAPVPVDYRRPANSLGDDRAKY